MRKPITLFLLLFLPAFAQAQQQHHEQAPEDPFRLQKLTENAYALYGRGGNVGFYIGPDCVLVIDSQFRELAPGIEQKIKTVTDKPIKYLLNTHHHGDHVGGNEHFIRFAVVIAHDNVRKRMLASPEQILKDFPSRLDEAKKEGNEDRIKYFSEQIEWAKKVRVEEIPAPFLTYDSQLQIHLGPEIIRVWHTPPAHTDGDSVVLLERANVIHMGDLFFHGRIPFIDVRSGGSARGYGVALDQVISIISADVKIIPGHGEVTNLNGLKTFRQYIKDLNDSAAKAKAAGKSKEDFLKEIDLPTYKDWDGYPDRFKTNAEAAYDEG